MYYVIHSIQCVGCSIQHTSATMTLLGGQSVGYFLEEEARCIVREVSKSFMLHVFFQTPGSFTLEGIGFLGECWFCYGSPRSSMFFDTGFETLNFDFCELML